MARQYVVEFRHFSSGAYGDWRWSCSQAWLPAQEGRTRRVRLVSVDLNKLSEDIHKCTLRQVIVGAGEGPRERGSFPLPSPQKTVGLENEDRNLVVEAYMFMGQDTLNIIEGGNIPSTSREILREGLDLPVVQLPGKKLSLAIYFILTLSQAHYICCCNLIPVTVLPGRLYK